MSLCRDSENTDETLFAAHYHNAMSQCESLRGCATNSGGLDQLHILYKVKREREAYGSKGATGVCGVASPGIANSTKRRRGTDLSKVLSITLIKNCSINKHKLINKATI